MPDADNHPLYKALDSAWPPDRWRDVTILLAVSGGADSMALLRAFHALAQRFPGPGRVLAAHVNHRLRGEESERDEEFVRQACQSWGLDLLVHCLGTKPDGMSTEEWARGARYSFLLDAAQARGARYVVTAHTADDQAETILHHVLRGTGLSGLAGMSPFRPLSPAVTLARPLLFTRRQVLREYLAELGQDFREDSSNRDTSLTRNRIRHDLLPHLAEQYNPEATEALIRLGRLAGESRTVIEALLAPLLERAVHVDAAGGRVALELAPLRDLARPIVRELFVSAWTAAGWPQGDMSFAHWNQLADLALNPQAPRRMFPGGIVGERTAQRVELRR